MFLSSILVSTFLFSGPTTRLHAGGLDLQIDGTGLVQSISVNHSFNLVPDHHASPLLCLRVDGKLKYPLSAKYNEHSRLLTLDFGDHHAVVRVDERTTHLSLELVKVQPAKDVEVAVWGPYATTLNESIGDTIGVVQGQQQAFGLQVLNVKTLGGYPNAEDDIEPDYSWPEKPGSKELDSFRGDTARPREFGSVVQAYVRNRSKTRIISNWGHTYYTAPAFQDGGVVGSKIGLFGSTSDDVLETIGKIEESEHLPHPIIDGVWGKVSPTAHESYLVMGFDTKNLDACVGITKEAGLRYLYSDSGFGTWGHFKLDPKGFPKNWESMKECVDRAKGSGVRLGVHTLSNFITPNDAYVTPIPDRRLAEVGASTLSIRLGTSDTEVEIQDPKFFNQMQNNTMRTVRIENELVQYDSVSKESPWRLLKCKRGAFGTKVSAHNFGTRIAKLMDHGYGTFLTNASLTQEVATNIANLYNKTGLLQLSMDGLEGNWSTGMGQYGRALFATTWYENLKSPVKGEIINDASNPGAFNWHIYTRMNWGEPWYAGFRKSQTQYRLKNQRYFKRNLMPGMLGWFQLTSETTLEDIQWLLARAAGFDAGFCITASLSSIQNNPHEHEILAAVKAWESARHSHAFPSELLADLQNIDNEYELTQTQAKAWQLTKVRSQKFSITNGDHEEDFDLGAYTENARIILQIPAKSKLTALDVTVDGKPSEDPGDSNGYKYFTYDLSGLGSGHHHLKIHASVSGANGASLDCELRTPLSAPFNLRPQTISKD